MPDENRVVIIGAGFGGLTAAKRFAGSGVMVTLIDRRNHHLFQPLLYQVATAALSPADIAAPIRGVLKADRASGLEILLDEATEIDTEKRVVRTSGGNERGFDYLILASGSRYDYFGHEDDWAPHAPSLKSLEDAVDIRRHLLLAFERAEAERNAAVQKKLMTFIIIGGGPTGVEMAGAIAELARASLARDFSHIDPTKARILLIEAGPKLLSSFTPKQGLFTQKALAGLGVETMLDTQVERVTADGVMANGAFIAAGSVFWCAGVRATALAGELGAETARNGAVKVREDMSVPGHDNIFVIGDAAFLMAPDGKPYPALAPVAKQQGAYVADLILARAKGSPISKPFRYRDWGSMATIGRNAAVGKFGRVTVQGFFAWLLWGAVHITYLIGFRNRAVVVINWLWAWITYAKGARLITGSVTSGPASQRDNSS